MPHKYRLPQGGKIDRQKPIKFTFNGVTIEGCQGDTIASALLANGIRITGRSFKYHRPRGIVTAGIEEPGTFVEVMGEGRSTTVPATMVHVQPEMQVKSINCWPNPKYDLAQLLQVFSPLLPSGFYYKTFFQPEWKVFEPFIRKMAGLAKIPQDDTPLQSYDSTDTHCEFLIVGGGISGIIATVMTAQTGKRVIWVDNLQNQHGGFPIASADKIILERWLQALRDQLKGFANVRILKQALAWGYREQNLVLVNQNREEVNDVLLWRIRARQVLLANGCTERGLVFPDNDRPGIMLASGVMKYCQHYAVTPGERIILYTNNNSIRILAETLMGQGKEISAIIDTREDTGQDYRGLPPTIKILTGYEITKVIGWNSVRGLIASSLSGDDSIRLSCDLLAVSGGWNPNLQLWMQSGGAYAFSPETATFVPTTSLQEVIALGMCAGYFNPKENLCETRKRVSELIENLGLKSESLELPQLNMSEKPYRIQSYWQPSSTNIGSKSFVDILNDVTLEDIKLALREGYDDIELVKRYTTLGMGLDQGKTGNVNATGIVATLSGKPMDDVGLIKYRSPVSPIPFGTVGKPEGKFIKPYRTTPITNWNRKNGAVLYEAGANWKRPGYYLLQNETMAEAINREARAVRNGLAIYDGSPLGTFEIKGRDAAKFLDMIYTNRIGDIPKGTGRYGLMLTEEGFILDDGVCFCMAENWYQVSVSTGNADQVHLHLEKCLRYDFSHLEVSVTNLTLQWMNATVCGPLARDFLQEFSLDIDLSPEKFPFMGIRDGVFNGMPVRIARVSFTGELSFEINVHTRYLKQLWERLISKGNKYGITPIGSETNHVLRVEKGFLSLGHEVDGVVDPIDLGLGWVMSKFKKDYIGKKAVALNRTSHLPRKELVGLVAQNNDIQFPEGAPIVVSKNQSIIEGHVTASVWSEINNRFVALALLNNGRSRISEIVQVRNLTGIEKGEVVAPCFYDPDGKRLRS